MVTLAPHSDQSQDAMPATTLWQQHSLKVVGWLYLLVGFLYLVAPIATLILFSFEDTRYPSLPWTGWTLRWYEQLFREGVLIRAFRHSMMVSPWAATVATIIGFFAAYALNRFQFRGKALLSGLLVTPILIPPLIMGVAFLGLLSRLNLQGQLFSVFIAHVVLLLAPATAVTQLRLAQMPDSIEEAAWDLGASEWQALWRVVLPWALPGIGGAWILAFTFSFDEFAIAWFVSGFEQTLPVAIFTYLAAQLDPSLNAVGTLIFLMSILLLIGVELILIPLFLDQKKSSEAES